MKIALINENSQAAKNALIEATLRKVVEPMGHEVVNYGMYAADDAARIAHAVEHLGQDHEHQRRAGVLRHGFAGVFYTLLVYGIRR